jgi:hypothetical protein
MTQASGSGPYPATGCFTEHALRTMADYLQAKNAAWQWVIDNDPDHRRAHAYDLLLASQSDSAGWCVSSKLAHMGKHSQNGDCVQWRVSQSDAAAK